ncbi:MAG: TraB/GumN family protein, partial [Deltaproteobacteria bacterium]|nr:TraB/GumN family protein [Deltaproteobacteria bacterium]
MAACFCSARSTSGSLFLLGSVHLGRSELYGFGPAVEEAYATSDELVVEVDLSLLSEQEIVAQSARYLVLPDGRMLRDELMPETWAKLEAYFRDRGAAITVVERLKPWAVSTVIAVMEFQAAGMKEEYGIDRYFIDDAAEARRPIRGLETLQSQLEALDGLSPRVQELMLEDALARTIDDPGTLVTAWEEGDEEWLTRQLFGPLEENPEFEEFYQAIFFRRNLEMTAQLAELVRDGRRR